MSDDFTTLIFNLHLEKKTEACNVQYVKVNLGYIQIKKNESKLQRGTCCCSTIGSETAIQSQEELFCDMIT